MNNTMVNLYNRTTSEWDFFGNFESNNRLTGIEMAKMAIFDWGKFDKDGIFWIRKTDNQGHYKTVSFVQNLNGKIIKLVHDLR